MTTETLVTLIACTLGVLANLLAARTVASARRERAEAAADWARAEEMRDHAVEILHDALEYRERHDKGPRDA